MGTSSAMATTVVCPIYLAFRPERGWCCHANNQVQCAFWGSPLSTGLPSIDYFLTGEAFTDFGRVSDRFSEQLVQFPGLGTYLFQPSVPGSLSSAAMRENVEDALEFRRKYNLPAAAPILFCPQTLAKFHPSFDRVVDTILDRLPAAVLVLIEVQWCLHIAARAAYTTLGFVLCLGQGTGPAWAKALRRRLSSSMKHSARVMFLQRLSSGDFIRMMAVSLVALDTHPYSGFTTTVEMLTVGTPVVTLQGSSLRRFDWFRSVSSLGQFAHPCGIQSSNNGHLRRLWDSGADHIK
jgi:protein O-GlcNAc transferase